MRPLAATLALGLFASLGAQSPLTTLFTGPSFIVGNLDGAALVQITVTAPAITVHRIDVNTLAAPGTEGRIRIWQTLPGITTFAGSESIAANWTLLAEGSVLSAGGNQPTICCFANPFTLTAAMGPRGYAIEYVGLPISYTVGNGSNQNYTNADLALVAGAVNVGSNYAEGDTAGSLVRAAPFTGSGTFNPRVWNGAIHYAVGTTATPCSYGHREGQRCGGTFDSWFDLHTAASAGAKLPGRRVTMSPNGIGGYTVIGAASPGLLPHATHPPLTGWSSTVAGAMPLQDGEIDVPLTTPFPFPGGTTGSLVVHNNGMISVASNLAFLDSYFSIGQNYDDRGVAVGAMLAAPNAGWYSWHDLDLASGGAVKFGESGTVAIFTWENVRTVAGAAPNTSTFQMTFDSATGVVTMAWQAVEALGAPNPLYAGNWWLVGFSAGGASLRPEVERDVSTNFVHETSSVERAELVLSAAPRPVFGSTVEYRIDNATVPEFGLLYFSLANPFAPGVPLSLIGVGKPDCMLNFDIDHPIGPFAWTSTAAPVLTLDTNTVSPTVLGLEFHAQSVAFDLGVPDLFAGLHTSNALHQRIESN